MASYGNCRVCDNAIQENYRVLSHTSISKEVLKTIIGEYDRNDGLSQRVCLMCVNKVRRLANIRETIKSDFAALREEENRLSSILGRMYSQNVQNTEKTSVTPVKMEKRKLDFTPTPKQPSKRRSLSQNMDVLGYGQNATPESQGKHPSNSMSIDTPTRSIGTQTFAQKPEKAFEVKIIVKYKSQTKSRIISSKGMQELCKAVVNGDNRRIIGKRMYDSEYREVVKQKVIQDLSTQCQQLCAKKDPSYLRSTKADDLLNVNWEQVTMEWKERAPLLFQVLEAIAAKDREQMNNKPETHTPVIGFHGASLLFERNQNLSLAQYSVGMIVDHGAATDETISILNKIGCCVSNTSIQRKKKELVEKHSEMLEELFNKQVSQVVKKKSSEAALLSLPSELCKTVSVKSEMMTSCHAGESNTSVSPNNDSAMSDPVDEMTITSKSDSSIY
ncbi:uncharacterized protein LOC144432684 [Glandiceps talaboti]